jgi:flagellar basal body rod protein FlgB
MNLPTVTTDNVTEILLKIIDFTRTRQKILIQNINSMHKPSFTPKDLPVEEFSKLMFQALCEHSGTWRLVFVDGRNIKFGANGSFEALPAIDEHAKRLLDKDRDEYLRIQINKLLENSLNQRIATELLKQKQSNNSCLGRCLN